MSEYLDSEIEGYDLCCENCGCKTNPEPKDGQRVCENTPECTKNRGCGCHMFKRKRRIEGNTPNPWKHVADPGKPITAILDEDYDYTCICVKRK